MTDLLNQIKVLHRIISTDTSNYFNQVAYTIAELICQDFRLLLDYVMTFFNTMQNMQMYFLLSFRLLSSSYSKSNSNLF